MTIGERIRSARKAAGMTQKQLGERSGIAEPTIRRYELGKLNPKFQTVEKIAGALRVNPLFLWGSSDDKDAIYLGSDISYMTSWGDIWTADSGTREAQILSILTGMNDTGKDEWIKRGDEMLDVPRYKKAPADNTPAGA